MSSATAIADQVTSAIAFSERYVGREVPLNFTLESLRTGVDSVLESATFFRGREGRATEEEEREEVELCAYSGETLRRLFHGTWGGDFYPSSNASNFDSFDLDFRGYRYWPSHFISYRLASWPQEGTLARHLERTLPHISQEPSESEQRHRSPQGPKLAQMIHWPAKPGGIGAFAAF